MSPFEKQNPNRAANLIAVISMMLMFATWAMGAVHVLGNDKVATAERITKTEVQQSNQKDQLDKLDRKVDVLDEKIDRILSTIKGW